MSTDARRRHATRTAALLVWFAVVALAMPRSAPAIPREPPALDAVWARDTGRPIDGPLPAELSAALDTALGAILQRVPQAGIALAMPGVGMGAVAGGDGTVDGDPTGPTTPFQVASLTKTFVAVAVLQLVEEGRLALEDPVESWLPGIPAGDAIRIVDLLEHTSGLVSFNALPDGRVLEDRAYAPDELLLLAFALPLQFPPGSAWAYTNTGYVALGRILEIEEERDLAAVLRERIIDPLGLAHTRLRAASDPGGDVAIGHARGEPRAASAVLTNAWAAGGMVSTASDLVRFWHALLGGRLLPPATVREMFAPARSMQPMYPVPAGTSTYYGRGVQITAAPGGSDGPGLLLGHSGGMPGYTAVVAYVIEDDAFVAVTLGEETAAAEAGLWVLLRAVRAARTDGTRP